MRQDRTIVLCFPIEEDQVERIRRAAGVDTEVIVSSQETIQDDIFRADFFFGHAKKQQIDWAAIVSAGRLRWIQSSAAGLDHCLNAETVHSEIVVSGCSALFADQVAEQTMMLLYGLMRRSHTFFRAQQQKSYVRQPTDNLHGKSVGIMGFGGNGQRVAALLGDVPRRIMATDCFHDSLDNSELPSPTVHLLPAGAADQLFAENDVVIVTLPLAAGNESIVDRDLLGRMKPGSYLINVGRGSVVNHRDLIDALKNGTLKGAGLDVVAPEPLPSDSPLWGLDNVIITPHVGAQSPLRVPLTVALICENLRRFDAGEALINVVDKKVGFPHPADRLCHPQIKQWLA